MDLWEITGHVPGEGAEHGPIWIRKKREAAAAAASPSGCMNGDTSHHSYHQPHCTVQHSVNATLHQGKDIEDTSKIKKWFLHPSRCQIGFWVLALNGLKLQFYEKNWVVQCNRDRQFICCRTVYIVVPSKKILYTKRAYCNDGTNTVTLWSCILIQWYYSYLALSQITHDVFFPERSGQNTGISLTYKRLLCYIN